MASSPSSLIQKSGTKAIPSPILARSINRSLLQALLQEQDPMNFPRTNYEDTYWWWPVFLALISDTAVAP